LFFVAFLNEGRYAVQTKNSDSETKGDYHDDATDFYSIRSLFGSLCIGCPGKLNGASQARRRGETRH
jgi:hypothetical protein